MLKNRKRNRLEGYDYTLPGYYFVTICSNDKIEWFGKINDGKMELNGSGQIIQQQWQWLKHQYPYVDLDEFMVMPNHMHGILILNNYVGNGHDRSVHERSLRVKSVSSLIGAFKTTSSKLIHQNNLPAFKWQKSFYDHIIRKDESLQNIREYIINNPVNWLEDEDNMNKLQTGLLPQNLTAVLGK